MEQAAMARDTEEMTRGQKLWLRAREARDTASISLHRARLFTAAFKETEGFPQPMRLARAFERVVREIPIYFDEGQLLAGDPASSASAAELHLENSVDWVKRELAAGRPPTGLTGDEVRELSEIVEYLRKETRHG